MTPSSELLWLQESVGHMSADEQTSARWQLTKSKTFALCVFSYM